MVSDGRRFEHNCGSLADGTLMPSQWKLGHDEEVVSTRVFLDILRQEVNGLRWLW